MKIAKDLIPNITFYLLVISVSFNAYLAKRGSNQSTTIYTTIQQYQECSIEKEEMEYNYRIKDSLQVISENIKISESIQLIDNNINKVSLLSILDSPKIVLYYSEFNCSECYSFYFINFLNIIEKYGQDKFILIGNFKNFGEFNAFIKTQKIKCQSFNLAGNKLGLPIENGEMPFMFYLDKSLKAQNVITIDKKYPLQNNSYLSNLAVQYFEE